jgi:hypothetical protein
LSCTTTASAPAALSRLAARSRIGVGDAVEVAERLRVGEHDRAQCGPVERSVGADHVGAEPRRDRVERRAPGSDHVARELVVVDHDRSPLGQQRADGALA